MQFLVLNHYIKKFVKQKKKLIWTGSIIGSLVHIWNMNQWEPIIEPVQINFFSASQIFWYSGLELKIELIFEICEQRKNLIWTGSIIGSLVHIGSKIGSIFRCEPMRIWTKVNRCEPIWTNVNRYEPMWTDVNQCEPVWTDVNRCEPMWTDVNRWGFKWTNEPLFEPVLINFFSCHAQSVKKKNK